MTTLLPGETAYRQWGALNIRIDRHHDGVAITVTHHPALNRAFTNLNQGRAYLEFLRDEANTGKPVWLIEAGAGALTSTTALGQDEAELVDDINHTIDATQPQGIDVSDILAGIEQASISRVENAIRAAEQPRRDFTRTRVATKPPTAAELAAIRAHTVNPDGTLAVRRLPGQSWLVLRALYRRLGGTRAYKPGTLIIDSLTYRPAQLAAHLTSERAA